MSRVSLFAVEDTAVQVCWADLPVGSVLRAGDATAEVGRPGPGAASLEHLPPDSCLDLTLRLPGRGPRPRSVHRFRTLAPPPGELLCRFATVNDLHVGERSFGLLRTLGEAPGAHDEPYPLRCARAAVDEAVVWGAEAIVAKGDLTWAGLPPEWHDVAALLGSASVPVLAVLGNHDVGKHSVDPATALAAHGIVVRREPSHHDLPGIRVVLADTAVAGKSAGRVQADQRQAIAELAGAAPGAVFVAMHHYPQRLQRAFMYPPGIPGDQAGPLLDALAAANASTFVSCGHSHRHRFHRHGPLVVTEIGATMHYPGTWAGYAVHEGGIRQVVRRVAAPEAIEWTERTRRALLGAWSLWTPGRREHRCFSHTWPTRASLANPDE